MKVATLSQYEDIYRGDTLAVKKDIGVLSINIPVDPNMKTVTEKRLRWLRYLNFVSFILEKISLPLLIGGTTLSWVVLILEPIRANYIILSIYILLILLRILFLKRVNRSLGVVTDRQSNQPMEMAIVRIYDAKTSQLATTRITNSRGQFNTLLAAGQYYLVIVKSGYKNFQSKEVTVTKRRGAIRFTAELVPQKGQEPVGGVGDQNIHLEEEAVQIRPEKKPVEAIEQSENINEEPSPTRKRAARKNAKK